jgi:hypothetical protein
MSILNDLMNVGTMGESQRIDYIIREHEKLKVQVEALVGVDCCLRSRSSNRRRRVFL